MSSIVVLDTGTAKLLTATQVITSPYSTIKELLENALDARATSISIEISANTVDVVQVRDNGHGIAPEDRGICCKRHTTSKLYSVSDLGVVGGRSLGFRGEALFAIAQVVGGMEVTTRVEGESPAVKLSVNREGEVTARQVASAAVGTTVRVTGMFANLPVRKQTAEKDASKCLAKIKKLLQSYALARPHVRLQMRVLKAKNDKLNFSYAPKANGEVSVRDAAWKVIGSEPASQSSWFVLETGGFEIQALLPGPDSVPPRISNVGHFLSIDGRPVGTIRGTPKHICKLVVEKMRASNNALAGIKDPFFVLNLVCPQGSYDPNVEPAKDDVMFHDADEVLKAVEELLNAIYPRPAAAAGEKSQDQAMLNEETHMQRSSPEHDDTSTTQHLETMVKHDDRDGSIAFPKPITHEQTKNQKHRSDLVDHDDALEPDEDMLLEPVANADEVEVLENRATAWRGTMYGYDDEDLDLLEQARQRQGNTDEDDAAAHTIDKRDLNPWTIAKMNMGRKPRIDAPPKPSRELTRSIERARSLSPVFGQRPNEACGGRMTPPLFSDDMRSMQCPRLLHDLGPEPMSSDLSNARGTGQHMNFRGLITPEPSSSPSRPSVQRTPKTPWNQGQRQHNSNANRAFKPSIRHDDFYTDVEDMRPARKRPKASARPNHQHGGPLDAWRNPAMKPNTIPRGHIGEPETDTPNGSELEEEFRARLRQQGEVAEAQLRAARHGIQASLTDLPVAEQQGWTPINVQKAAPAELERPRSTARRRRTTESRRTKSSRLPLERVPNGSEVHHLVHCVNLNAARLETVIFSFTDLIVDDVGFEDELVDKVDEEEGEDFSIRLTSVCGTVAIRMLRDRLHEAEHSNDDELRLAYIGTLARLEKS